MQLPLADRVGLLVVSFILGQACWYSAKQMLAATASEDRIELLGTFTLYVSKLHSTEVAEWVATNWKVVEDEHLQLINHLKA